MRSKLSGPFLIKSNLLEGREIPFHCFSTRAGGASEGPYRWFNLSLSTGDSHISVSRNQAFFEEATGIDMRTVIFPKQVHGDKIIVVRGEGSFCGGDGEREEADALITNIPGRAIGIMTADCVPIIAYDPVNRAAGVIHSGWRSTVLNISGKTIKSMKKLFGTDAKDLLIAIGPSIKKCCYEVGEEVASRFKKEFEGKDGIIEKKDERLFLSLSDAIVIQLEAEGVKNDNIDLLDYCTCCDEKLFYSYRRDGAKTGRMVTVAKV